MASNASLIVTPFRFRAVTSRPSGKCRSIFLTGGFVRCFFRASGSSTELVEVLSFLLTCCQSTASFSGGFMVGLDYTRWMFGQGCSMAAQDSA